MKKLACLALLLFFAVPAFADIPPPPTPKKGKEIDARMRIETRRDLTEARLIIPKSMSKQLRAELDGEDSNSFAGLSGGFSPTQTIFAGVLLSLAFVFGGVWFVKSAKETNKTGRAALIFALLFAGGAAATAVFANIAPPSLAKMDSGVLSDQARRFGVRGNIKIEISSDETQIVLQLPEKPEEPSR